MKSPALFCDLGNVILPFDREKTFKAWAYWTGISPDDIRESFMRTDILERHETGKIVGPEFCEAVRAAIGASDENLHDARLLRGWVDNFELDREVLRVLQDTREQGVELLLLSNIGFHHYDWICRRYPEIVALFDHLILSYDQGVMKPDAEIYEAALDCTGRRDCPQSAVFVDDLQTNIEAASALGIRTHQFTCAEAMRSCLVREGVLKH